MKQIKAFIFDLDGVLTETSEQHYIAWKKLAEELGITIDRAFNERLKGVSRDDSLALILKEGNKYDQYSEKERQQLANKKNGHYLDLIDDFSSENLFEGVEELFISLKSRKIKIAIGSASKNAPRLLKAMKVEHLIDYIVNPTLLKGKPAPDIFLKAAEYFNVLPEECIGIEDAVSGIKAIKSAGMFAIGIGKKEILNQADVVYDQIKEINLDKVLKLVH